MTDDLVVILTALNAECDAVRRNLVDPRRYEHNRGTLFEIGTVRGTTCRVALAVTHKGNQAAAVLAERAIEEFEPAALLFVGVAGALWDATSLGDVVVATHVYAYHGGTSEDDGFKARPRAWELAHRLFQLATYLGRSGDWHERVPMEAGTPRVHFAPIAAGEVVQNSRISYEATLIRKHYNDALAIEMEAAGIAQAGHLSEFPVAIVRGISDRADGTKNSTEDRAWQPLAAANAAAFAVRLADELTKGQESVPMSKPNKGNGNIEARTYGSTIGAIGHLHNSTVNIDLGTSGSSGLDLTAELADLGLRLQHERSVGALDEATFDAAQAELDTASKALEANTPEEKSTMVVALKKLRGLIEGIADLGSKIATIIAAAQGLS